MYSIKFQTNSFYKQGGKHHEQTFLKYLFWNVKRKVLFVPYLTPNIAFFFLFFFLNTDQYLVCVDNKRNIHANFAHRKEMVTEDILKALMWNWGTHR